MELQSQVRVYNEAMGVKGAKGRLVQIHQFGYYEVALEVKERSYHSLLPIAGTVLLAADAIPDVEQIDVERF